MSRAVVENLIALLNRSFDGENTQSLLANVHTVERDDWDWLAPGGERTIRDIFVHAAVAKHIYTDYLFGGANRIWDEVETEARSVGDPDDVGALVEWAQRGHAAFMRGMASLQDADLAEMTTKWHGAADTTGEVIAVMIQHDCYHAGEINHIRAIHQERDTD
jgi:uncharacterized damage-inducible protein DinB